jgi:protein SCO1/2
LFLNLRAFINLLILVALGFLLPIEVDAQKEEQNHSQGEEKADIKQSGSPYQLAVINQAPDFVLVDIKGQRVSLKDLKDKIKVISFIYTSCPDACPIVTARLSRLQAILKKEGVLGEKVRIVSISFDPDRDTERQLKRYADGFKANSDSWLFLRGTQEQTKKVLSDYDIWLKKLDDGTIDHVMRVYLVDGKDRIREIYNLGFLQPELVIRDIEMVLNEK